MLKKLISIRAEYTDNVFLPGPYPTVREKAEADDVTLEGPIVVGVRSAGEVGFGLLELLAMREGGHPIDVHYFTRDKYRIGDGLAPTDKLVTKARGRARDFKGLSNHPWAGVITGIRRTGEHTRELISPFGNLPITVHFLPDRNLELDPVRELAESDQRFVLFDATGNVRHNDRVQSPLQYLSYPRLLSVHTAPAKKATALYPHMLEGVNIGSHVTKWLDARDALNALISAILHTGSCTTHGGAVVIFVLDKNIRNFRIISGNLTSIHARTPTDVEAQLDENFIAQATGFGRAGKIVLPTQGIENVDALAIRANVFGSSFNIITLTVRADEKITREKVIGMFRREAQGDMHDQIAILSETALSAHNKKGFAVNSSIAVKGLLHTAVIDPSMITVSYNEETDTYQINIKVAYYDNVGGFNYALLREASSIATRRWGLDKELFPHGHIWDYSSVLSFFNTNSGRSRTMFGNLEERWDAVDGVLLEGQPEEFARHGRLAANDRID